jgi:uncharacterized protein (TIGR02145 family)
MEIKNKYRCPLGTMLLIIIISAYGCEDNDQPDVAYGKVTDIEGNDYKTVLIGNQVWMAEDLRVNKYNDGTDIPFITDKNTWANTFTDAFCWFSNEKAWGTLYNWYAVNTGKLAPEGWHVATDDDWTTLTDFLEGADVAGGKLKEKGIKRWGDPNIGATNIVGFTAIPAGCRELDGDFVNFGGCAYYWTSTEYHPLDSWERQIFWSETRMYREHVGKVYGFSVRCVRDQ